MKMMRKLMAFLLAAVLALALGVTAFADEPVTPTEVASGLGGEGSITIKEAVSGKNYELYRIFDLTYGEGTPLPVSYTINSAWEGFFAASAPGEGYIVASDTEPASLSTIVVDGTTTKYINITESNVPAFAETALAWCADHTPDVTYSFDADNTSMKVTGLPLGYYLVYPEGAAEIKDSLGSICSLTSTVPAATVVIKSEYPTITKTVDDEDRMVYVGQELTYTITGKVPDVVGYSTYEYTLTDTMTPGLTFMGIESEKGFNVSINGSAVRETDFKVKPTVAGNGFTFTIDFIGKSYQVGQPIVVTCKATVDADAIARDTERNKVVLTYSDKPSNSESVATAEAQVDVYTFNIQVTKFTNITTEAGSAEKTLANAIFCLKDSEGKYYRQDETTKAVTWVNEQDNATKLTTPANGIITFEGLDAGTFYLSEYQAPAGYNALTSDVEVKIVDRKSATFGGAAANPDTDTRKISGKIENNTGALLPETGGEGTKLLIACGCILFLGTAVVLVTKKRMYNKG